MDELGDFILRIILVLLAIFLGATVTFMGGLSGATPPVHRPSVIDQLNAGGYSLVPPALAGLILPPLSYQETVHLVGDWGCHLKSGMPYSVLAVTQCF